jgi:hypothetical protein
MTIEKFNATGWTSSMTAKWNEDGETYRVWSVDFGESLVALVKLGIQNPGAEEIQWARCENITLNPPNVES